MPSKEQVPYKDGPCERQYPEKEINELYQRLIELDNEGKIDLCGSCRRGTQPKKVDRYHPWGEDEDPPRCGDSTTRQMAKVYTFEATPFMDVCIELFGGYRKNEKERYER